MSKYINIEDMRIALHKLLDEGKWLEKETTENIFRAFKSLPKIEIVQCKDCKFRLGGYHNLDCRWDSGSIPKEDDFCSYGKQEE